MLHFHIQKYIQKMNCTTHWVKTCEAFVFACSKKHERCECATTEILWYYLRYTKETLDISLPHPSTGVLATLARLNKPWLFEEHDFEPTTKHCMLKYLQIWHPFNTPSSALQLYKKHLGRSEMQTSLHKTLCVKASKRAQVVSLFPWKSDCYRFHAETRH